MKINFNSDNSEAPCPNHLSPYSTYSLTSSPTMLNPFQPININLSKFYSNNVKICLRDSIGFLIIQNTH